MKCTSNRRGSTSASCFWSLMDKVIFTRFLPERQPLGCILERENRRRGDADVARRTARQSRLKFELVVGQLLVVADGQCLDRLRNGGNVTLRRVVISMRFGAYTGLLQSHYCQPFLDDRSTNSFE